MCFEIIELRDLKCDLFQAFLAKLSWENGFYDKSEAANHSKADSGQARQQWRRRWHRAGLGAAALSIPVLKGFG